MRIEKKAWPELFEKVRSGVKTFDLRLADFEAREGDTLVLKEWIPETKEYTGRVVEKQISFVLNTKGLKFWSEKDVAEKGFVVMALK